jgi:uncharacterized protein YjeT (DUF2065 family)
LIGILTPVIGPILTAFVGWRSARMTPRRLLPVWSLLAVAVTVQLTSLLQEGAVPPTTGSASGLSFVAGDNPVPSAARQAVQELVDQPVPALRDAWSLILFSAFAIGTVVLMWYSAAPARKLSEATNATN